MSFPKFHKLSDALINLHCLRRITDSQSDKSLAKTVMDVSPHCSAGISPVNSLRPSDAYMRQ